MDVLPIQGTSVPCERVFSSSKETSTARRSQMTPELMESLQLLKFSIRKGRGLNFTYTYNLVDELQELERQTSDQRGLPENINSYSQHLLNHLNR